jgi:hypothetical protein
MYVGVISPKSNMLGSPFLSLPFRFTLAYYTVDI